MSAHRLPGHESVRLVIEDDAPLCEALTSVGAEVVLAISHMAGPIP